MTLKRPSPSALLPSEWFLPVHVDSIPSKGKDCPIQASLEQCQAIAKRLDIQAVNSLAANVHLTLQNGGHIVYISGNFTAEITQNCVVTLQPIVSQIQDNFEAWYADHDKAIPFNRAKHTQKSIEDGLEIQMLEEHDDPEPLVDSQVDIGEVVIQFLSLAINPYPRVEGTEEAVMAPVKTVSSDGTGTRPNPFAALKNWRPKD
jgi:hypothetical protein